MPRRTQFQTVTRGRRHTVSPEGSNGVPNMLNTWSTHKIKTWCRHSCILARLLCWVTIYACVVVGATRPEAQARWIEMKPPQKVLRSKTKFKTHEMSQKKYETYQHCSPLFQGSFLAECILFKIASHWGSSSIPFALCTRQLSPTLQLLSTRLSMLPIGLPMKRWRKLPHASQNQSKNIPKIAHKAVIFLLRISTPQIGKRYLWKPESFWPIWPRKSLTKS